MYLLNCLSPGIELWPLFYIWSKKTCEAPQSLASPVPLPSPIPSWVTIPFNFLEQMMKIWILRAPCQELVVHCRVKVWVKGRQVVPGENISLPSTLYQVQCTRYQVHWTWGKHCLPTVIVMMVMSLIERNVDVWHSQFIIIYIKSLTCISQCDMFSSCPSPAWLGWSGQLSLPFLWIFTSFHDFYFSISAWLSLFVFCLEPYFLNGIWYFDNHQFISCHDAMMQWCNVWCHDAMMHPPRSV